MGKQLCQAGSTQQTAQTNEGSPRAGVLAVWLGNWLAAADGAGFGSEVSWTGMLLCEVIPGYSGGRALGWLGLLLHCLWLLVGSACCCTVSVSGSGLTCCCTAAALAMSCVRAG